jgi:hypothetical protein
MRQSTKIYKENYDIAKGIGQYENEFRSRNQDTLSCQKNSLQKGEGEGCFA